VALYLKVMNLLNVKPEQSIAIAFKRARMWCMTISNKDTKELEFGKSDINLTSVQEVQLI
jgi:hypothetical protein